jgi:hypothetical protein
MEHFVARATHLLWNNQVVHDVALAAYVKRIMNSTTNNVCQTVLYMALLYIMKLSKNMPQKRAKKSEYRIIVTALMLADTFVNDNSYTVASWSQVTNFANAELVGMRREFLETIGYNLSISAEDYSAWVTRIHYMIDPPVFRSSWPGYEALDKRQAVNMSPISVNNFAINFPVGF